VREPQQVLRGGDVLDDLQVNDAETIGRRKD
jgi:hypothetical protein